ncbi:EamA family transporter [Thioclava kandeliae]|uniref:EamA/RhaT family transporter n=1 Tax=Thioclava kandeliae TaxID=3070818 RepID=A0ABV1SC92_9RHOB
MWILLTLLAAALQTGRFVLQKKLAGSGLSAGGATFSRFVFGAPLAIAGTLALVPQMAAPLDLFSKMGGVFWAYVIIGGAAQASATLLLVRLFQLRNFAVGVAFTKTEVVQVALMSLVFLGDHVAPLGWAGIVLGLVGVLCLSRPPQGGAAGKPAFYGIIAGGLFGLSAIAYRGATLELMPFAFFDRALATLACVTTVQTLGMGLYLRLREKGELTRVMGAWSRTIWVGILGAAGSAGWFMAFALQNAAYVRALGQVEMVFTLGASILIFHERLHRREMVGIALVLVSVLAVVMAA